MFFHGKVLDPSDKLEDLGVSAGDVLNVLKGRKARVPKADLNIDNIRPSPVSRRLLQEVKNRQQIC